MSIIDKEIIYNIKNCKYQKRFNNYIIDKEHNIIIKQEDAYKLISTSPNIKLQCICDHCGKEFVISCQKLTRSQGKSKAPTDLKKKNYQDDLVLCKQCRVKHTNRIKYGTDNVLQNENIRKQVSITLKNRSDEEKQLSLQKSKQTCLERYGVEYSTQSKRIKAKILSTIKERYGEQYTSTAQVPEVKAKQIATLQQHYGKQYTNSMQVPEVKRKAQQSLFQNNAAPVSKIQKYIYDILYEQEENKDNIVLNYLFGSYFLDIALIKEKIDLEYDGSGHKLNIIHSHISEDEFYKNERIRNYYVLRRQWKIIRIISNTDYWFNGKLFSKEQLLQIINFAKKYLLETIHSWIYINLDEDKVITTKYEKTISDLLNNQITIQNTISELQIQQFIQENYLYMTTKEIAQKLNVTLLQIQYQYKKLQIKAKRDSWTREEIEYLKNNYLKMSITEIAKKINKKSHIVRYELKKLNLK